MECERSGEEELAAYYRKLARKWNIMGIIGGTVAVVLAILILVITLAVVFSLNSDDD